MSADYLAKKQRKWIGKIGPDYAHWKFEGDHMGFVFATASIVRAGREIICKHLRTKM